MGTLKNFEIKSLKTNRGRIKVFVATLNETLEELESSTANVYDLNFNVAGTTAVVGGTLLLSIISADDQTAFSPIYIDDVVEVNDTFSFKRSSTYGFEWLKNDASFYGASGGINNMNALPVFILSDDGYCGGTFYFIPNIFIIDEERFSFFKPCDTSNLGECLSTVGMNLLPTANVKIGTSFTRSQINNFTELYKNVKILDTDPYLGGGNSGGGGGTGDFDDTSDTIGLPSLPSLSGLNTGFFTAFIPSASQMQSVSNYLWNNLITDMLDPEQTIGEKIDALKKVVANPYDAIMGCSIIPVSPPTAGSKELKMYGLIKTGISLPYASSRWVSVDCGTLNIKEFWGGYLDYSPYTKTTSLYLPYIGTVSIDIDLIMAKALRVVYYVDILTGICVAFVLVDGSVKFHFQGQCSTQIPITNADYNSTISAGIGLIGNVSQVVGSAVTGGASGGIAGAVAGAVGSAISQAPSIASNVMGAKPDIRSGGSIGSSAGILSVQKPYLIIERPKQSLPERQNTFTGYPSNITADVGSLSGYTEFESINLDGLSLTAKEKQELENLLKGGVYL